MGQAAPNSADSSCLELLEDLCYYQVSLEHHSSKWKIWKVVQSLRSHKQVSLRWTCKRERHPESLVKQSCMLPRSHRCDGVHLKRYLSSFDATFLCLVERRRNGDGTPLPCQTTSLTAVTSSFRCESFLMISFSSDATFQAFSERPRNGSGMAGAL